MSAQIVLVVGASGALGQRIVADLKSSPDRYEVLEVDSDPKKGPEAVNQKALEHVLFCKRNVFAIIASPPKTHFSYVEALFEHRAIAKIFCEKPFPGVASLEPKYASKVRVVDHYLYKKALVGDGSAGVLQASAELKSFREQLAAGKVKRIDLALCEAAPETRPWMFSRFEFGGVAYDLGHHLIAALGFVTQDPMLTRLDGLEVTNVERFDGSRGNADEVVEATASYAGIPVTLKVAKNRSNNKQMTWETRGGVHSLPLISLPNAKVSYRTILAYPERCLELPVAVRVNAIIERLIAPQSKGVQPNELVGVVQALTDDFTHRQGFYWSSYYRLMVYSLFVLSLPLFGYYFASQLQVAKASGVGDFGLVVIAASVQLLLYIGWVWWPRGGVNRIISYLEKEDERVKLDTNALRSIYWDVFGMAMSPRRSLSGQGLGGKGMTANIRRLSIAWGGMLLLVWAALIAMPLLQSVDSQIAGSRGIYICESGFKEENCRLLELKSKF